MTTRVEMNRDGLDTLAAIGGADAELVRALSQDYVDFYLQAGHKGMVVHDCCACIALTRPELFQFERASVRVATDGVARGMTIPSRKAWHSVPACGTATWCSRSPSAWMRPRYWPTSSRTRSLTR